MRKQTLHNLFLSILCLVFFNLNMQELLAQRTHKPAMWVDNSDSQKDRDNFKKEKLEKMSQNAHSPDVYLNTHFPLKNFWNWVKFLQADTSKHGPFLHVYPGINEAKKVVLIFAPAKSTAEEHDYDSYVFTEGFDAARPGALVITPEKKRELREKYDAAMHLTPEERGRDDNQYPHPDSSSKKPSDTKFVTYCWADIIELLETKNHFASKLDITENARGYLAAYPKDTGSRTPGTRGRFKNRILIYFDFLDSTGADVDLTDLKEFRDLLPSKGSQCRYNKNFVSNDNGQLCPTTCD